MSSSANLTGTQQDMLIQAALQAREVAYAPYSNYRVGAALLAASGATYAGCNVENGSLGLTICAERVAACTAVAAGQREFQALALTTAGGATPCGACRQFLAEFCEDLPILLVDVDQGNSVRQVQLSDLLPQRYRL